MEYKLVKQTVKEWIHTANWHNIVIYLIFVVVSTLFWFMMKLNEEIQRDYTVPVQIENLPEGMTMLRTEALEFNVTVKDKGSSLIKYELGKDAILKLDYNDILHKGNLIHLSQQQMLLAFRNLFGQDKILSFKPDSLLIPFTTLSPKKVAVNIDYNSIVTKPQYVISNIILSPDSVELYSSTEIDDNLKSVNVQSLNLSNISDTTIVSAKVIVPAGVISKPENVKIKMCIVPLITAKKPVNVDVINVPEGRNVVTFPSNVEVSYLVPMDYFKSDNIYIKIRADYANRNSLTSKLPVIITEYSNILRNLTLSADSVEFLIE